MDNQNYYEDKENRQFFNKTAKVPKQKPEQEEKEPEKWKETAKGVGTDLVIGVLGGGLLAAAIGRPAFLVGLAVSGYGHYAQNKVISALGLGIMASGTMSALNKKGEDPNMKERLIAFREELKRKIYLDKLLPVGKESLSASDQNKDKNTSHEANTAI